MSLNKHFGGTTHGIVRNAPVGTFERNKFRAAEGPAQRNEECGAPVSEGGGLEDEVERDGGAGGVDRTAHDLRRGGAERGEGRAASRVGDLCPDTAPTTVEEGRPGLVKTNSTSGRCIGALSCRMCATRLRR